ncbi:hypothetical protein GGU11DRAFT_445149 [Lentinula aff. detonsa]|nr:hypothetical protein GGU11DRAFT_445149 [Lentinula aff. detonsa]
MHETNSRSVLQAQRHSCSGVSRCWCGVYCSLLFNVVLPTQRLNLNAGRSQIVSKRQIATASPLCRVLKQRGSYIARLRSRRRILHKSRDAKGQPRPTSFVFSINSLHQKMCHNIIDGRFYTECRHFHAMATHKQDCLRDNCVFSVRHTHSYCKSPNCIRMMAQPVQNPIRFSSMNCANCRARDGTFGHR